MPIDTHQVFKHLKRDDVFTEEQADRLADALSDMDVASATKEDLNELEQDVKTHIEHRLDTTESRLGERIERVEKRILAIGLPAVGAIIAVLNYLMG